MVGNSFEQDFDEGADAILIELEEVDHWDDEVRIEDAMFCGVAFRHECPVGVSLRCYGRGRIAARRREDRLTGGFTPRSG